MKKFILGLMLLSSFSALGASVECGAGDSYDIKYAVSEAQSELNSKVKKLEAQRKADLQTSRSISISNLVMTQSLQGNNIVVSVCVIVD